VLAARVNAHHLAAEIEPVTAGKEDEEALRYLREGMASCRPRPLHDEHADHEERDDKTLEALRIDLRSFGRQEAAEGYLSQ
jgi:hypothetical protein